MVSVMMAVEASFIVAATVADFRTGCGADGAIGTCKGVKEMEGSLGPRMRAGFIV